MSTAQNQTLNQEGFFSFAGVLLLVVILGTGWLLLSRLSLADETVQITSVNAVSGSLPFGLVNPFQKPINPDEFTPLKYRIPNGWAKYGEGAGYKFFTPKDWLTVQADSSQGTKRSLVVQSPNYQTSDTGAVVAGARLTFEHNEDRWFETISADNADTIVEQFGYGGDSAVQRFQIDQTNGIRFVDATGSRAMAIWYADGSKYRFELNPVAKDDFPEMVRIFDKVIASFNFF